MKPPVCPACGARLPDGATRCDLCGYDLADEAPADAEEPAAFDPGEPAQVAAPPTSADQPERSGPFCTQCGTRNPAGARFCFSCGHALHNQPVPTSAPSPVGPAAVPAAPPPVPAPLVRPDSDPGKRALGLIGLAVLAVLALYFITTASKNAPPAPTDTPAATAPVEPQPLPQEVADQVATLEGEIAAASGDERLAKQAELVELYVRAGAFAEAGRVQEALAEAEQTALAWADAGSFYLASMLRTEGPERPTLARQSAAAYERSLELDPDDLDVKTDLATAYLNDTQNPMLAVETVKAVLEEEPDHVRANFNYGLMLAQINRVPQAVAQFEKVVTLTESGDPVHERAVQELERLRAAQAGTAAG